MASRSQAVGNLKRSRLRPNYSNSFHKINFVVSLRTERVVDVQPTILITNKFLLLNKAINHKKYYPRGIFIIIISILYGFLHSFIWKKLPIQLIANK